MRSNGIFSLKMSQWLYVVLCACLPWSMNTAIWGSASMHLPAEALEGLLALWMLVQLAQRRILWPILTIEQRYFGGVVLLGLLWGWVATAFSSMPMVSVKYMLVATVHVFVFFGYPLLDKSAWLRGISAFAYAMAGMVVYTVFRLVYYFHLRDDQANLAPMPFLDDHTIYACILVILIFITPVLRYGYALLPIWVLGLVLSTCRAAILSVFAAIVFWLLYQLYHRYQKIALFLGVLGAGALYLLFGAGVFSRVRLDVSSAERWNRYNAAARMAAARPVQGFGPGTYQFQYFPFQKASEMTRISVTAPIAQRDASNFGRGGGAHSEYMQAWSETGWVGLLLLLAVVLFPFVMGWGSGTQWGDWLAWYSYWFHGIFNHFLHDSRIAILVWGIAACWFFRLPQKSV